LPEETAFYLTPDSIPHPPNWDRWFPWTATADVKKPSVIDASGLLESPAGKHGRVKRSGDQLIYNGKPIKFWGLNTCYEAIASPKEVSDQRSAFYAKYGVNAVRLHKFADGPDWDGILDRNSCGSIPKNWRAWIITSPNSKRRGFTFCSPPISAERACTAMTLPASLTPRNSDNPMIAA